MTAEKSKHQALIKLISGLTSAKTTTGSKSTWKNTVITTSCGRSALASRSTVIKIHSLISTTVTYTKKSNVTSGANGNTPSGTTGTTTGMRRPKRSTGMKSPTSRAATPTLSASFSNARPMNTLLLTTSRTAGERSATRNAESTCAVFGTKISKPKSGSTLSAQRSMTFRRIFCRMLRLYLRLFSSSTGQSTLQSRLYVRPITMASVSASLSR